MTKKSKSKQKRGPELADNQNQITDSTNNTNKEATNKTKTTTDDNNKNKNNEGLSKNTSTINSSNLISINTSNGQTGDFHTYRSQNDQAKTNNKIQPKVNSNGVGNNHGLTPTSPPARRFEPEDQKVPSIEFVEFDSTDNDIDNFLVPQVIKVVSLADYQNQNQNDIDDQIKGQLPKLPDLPSPLNKNGTRNQNDTTKSSTELPKNSNESTNGPGPPEEIPTAKKAKHKRHRKKTKPPPAPLEVSEIQSPPFTYSGNNIVLVSSSSDFPDFPTMEDIPPSCIDNTNFQVHRGPKSNSSDDNYILGDLDTEGEGEPEQGDLIDYGDFDDEDEGKTGSWCLASLPSDLHSPVASASVGVGVCDADLLDPITISMSSLSLDSKTTSAHEQNQSQNSYQAASAFQIGPDTSNSNSSTCPSPSVINLQYLVNKYANRGKNSNSENLNFENMRENSGIQESTAKRWENSNLENKRENSITAKRREMKSPDSESSLSSNCEGSIPPSAACSNMWEELRPCDALNCTVSTSITCGQCKVAYYCSKEHQKEDWKRHKKSCAPYRIQDVGFGADGLPVCAAVACRNIPAGQVIFSESPMLLFPLAQSNGESQFTHVMDLKCVGGRCEKDKEGRKIKSHSWKNCERFCEGNAPACLGCTKVVEFIGPSRYKCNNCRLPLCSYNCQFLMAHQAGECEAISTLNLNDESWGSCHHTLYMDVEILRALQLENYNNRMWERLLEMRDMVRVESYKRTDAFKLFAQNMKSLVPLSAKMSGYNFDLIADVHAIITSLSYRPSISSSYKVLFNVQPQFAHHCVPNSLSYLEEEGSGDQHKMKLVTKAATAILKTEIITIDFTPSPYLPYPRRHQVLKDLLAINNCLCVRCQNPTLIQDFTAEVKCPICRCGTVSPETPSMWQDSVWSCRRCQEEISFTKIESIERVCWAELSHIINEPRVKAMNKLVDFIHRRGELDLNPTHHLIIMAWCYLESFLRNELKSVREPDPSVKYSLAQLEGFKRLGNYAEVMYSHLECIRPGLWIDKGIVLFHKFYSKFVWVCKEYQEGSLTRKEFISWVMKCMKMLQEALQIFSVYEGYNEGGVSSLTQEATSALASLKEYIQFFLNQNENDPLPTMKQVLNRS